MTNDEIPNDEGMTKHEWRKHQFGGVDERHYYLPSRDPAFDGNDALKRVDNIICPSSLGISSFVISKPPLGLEAINVVVSVAEQALQYPQAFEVEAHVLLVGHADPTVQLD